MDFGDLVRIKQGKILCRMTGTVHGASMFENLMKTILIIRTAFEREYNEKFDATHITGIVKYRLDSEALTGKSL